MRETIFEMENSPQITKAINAFVQTGCDLGLTANDFDIAVEVAKKLVRQAAMNRGLRELDAKVTDCKLTGEGW